MPTFPRLVLKVPLAKEQSQVVNYLMDAEGLCTCDRFLKRTDGKLCLAQINTNFFPVPEHRNLLVIGAYCFECANKINETLKSLKNKLAHPEPDWRRHEKAV